MKYARNEKFMGNVVFANSKALPAPAAAAKAVAPSAVKTAAKNTMKVAPIVATAASMGDNKAPQANSSNVDEVVRITKQGIADAKNPKPAAAPTPKATIKKAEKVIKVTASKSVGDDEKEVPGGAVAIKDMGAKSSVQMYGNVDGYGAENEAPDVKDPSEGMSEEQLKKIGLDASNAEMAARGDTGSFLGRLSEGNIDDANSVAYKKYGAGYGREVLRRRAAGK
jgi:hypothetical protein